MNKTIKDLNTEMGKLDADQNSVRERLKAEWYKVFDDSGVIKSMMVKVENSPDYRFDEYGEIVSYAYVDLSNFEESKEYLVEYLRDSYCAELDLENDCITYHQGDSILIQDDTRHDNGVWLNGKRVINETEYKDEDGDINETKRNELIEAYMEKSGFFPGVFRCDRQGSVFPVSTQVQK